MSKNIDLLNKRFMQITIAFMVLIAIDQFFHVPHSGWFIMTGTLIYSGADPTSYRNFATSSLC